MSSLFKFIQRKNHKSIVTAVDCSMFRRGSKQGIAATAQASSAALFVKWKNTVSHKYKTPICFLVACFWNRNSFSRMGRKPTNCACHDVPV